MLSSKISDFLFSVSPISRIAKRNYTVEVEAHLPILVASVIEPATSIGKKSIKRNSITKFGKKKLKLFNAL